MLFDFALAISPVAGPSGHLAAAPWVATAVTVDDGLDAPTVVSVAPHTEAPTLVDHHTHHGRPALRCIRTERAEDEAEVLAMRRVLAGRMATRRHVALSIVQAMSDAELPEPIRVPDPGPASGPRQR